MSKQLYHFLYSVFPPEHQWKISLLAQWDQIIGTLKDKVILEKIGTDTVVLTVIHSTWAQELYMLSPILTKKINAVIGHEQIKHIKFKVGQEGFKNREREKEKKNHLAHLKQKEGKVIYVKSDLSSKEKKVLEKVESNELAEKLLLFYERCKRVNANRTK